MIEHPSDWPDDAIEVAVVLGAWGVRGGLRVKPHASDPQALLGSRRWYWKPSDRMVAGAAERLKALEQPLRIADLREQGDALMVQVHDLTDRELAQACRGLRLFVRRSSFPTADADEFYWVDLIGLAVVNRQGVDLGTVRGLLQTGPHSVLEIERPPAESSHAASKERVPPPRLIPFVKAYVDEVDRPGGRITVDWDPED